MSNECCNNNCNQGRDCPERRVADRRAEQHAPCYYDTDRNKPLAGRAAAQAVPELVTQLREYAGNPGYSHGDYADAMRQAADALDTTKGA